MGYTYGQQWNDELIKNGVLQVVEVCKLGRMPSRSECVDFYGNHKLANAVSRRNGGWYKLADELGLPIKKSDTYFGKMQEYAVCEMLREQGFETERMPQNFPYDILVDNCVKVDVKASRLYKGKNGNFYAFNLEKKYATCDVYILLTLDNENNITNTLIVPSVFVIKNTQISVGEQQSKYYQFKDKWDYISSLSAFCGNMLFNPIRSGDKQ